MTEDGGQQRARRSKESVQLQAEIVVGGGGSGK
jgi:hypothetical protein